VGVRGYERMCTRKKNVERLLLSKKWTRDRGKVRGM